jgi:NAD(P)-dependent dehydrogenase (short-subunit alcohol dehydrogenase family)
MERKNALIPGASGIIGRTLIEYLSSLDDWNIVGLSRRKPESKTEVKFIEVDLLDRADCQQKLSGLKDITHIFYAAYQPYSYDKLVAWQFGDAVFRMDYDVILDTNKIRRFGFHEYIDSEKMFLNRFSELQRNRVIP